MPDAEVLAVGINARGAVTGAKVYNDSVKKMGQNTDKTAGKMKSFGGTATKLFAAIGGALILRKTIMTISSFEDTMAQLQGVTSATTSQMQIMSSTARELGATTRFSASQAAEGLLALSRAGFTVEESTKAIAATLTLATAAQLELGRASEITSNTIRQFGLKASDANKVADILVNTANKANTDVEGLAEALKFAGVNAGVFGISLAETNAALGALANVGLRGGMAGRGLSMVLATLAGPTEGATKALKNLGLTLEEVDPQKVGIIGGMQALNRVNAQASDITRIFGKSQLKTVLALMKSTEAMEAFRASNEKANGVAKRNADLMENTLSGAYLELKSAIEETMLSAGDTGFLGIMKETLKVTTSVVRALTGVGQSSSKTFLKMQLATNKTLQGLRVFWKMSTAGWDMIFEVIKTGAVAIPNFFIGAYNLIIDANKKFMNVILDSVRDLMETLTGVASLVSDDLTEALVESMRDLDKFKTGMNKALDDQKIKLIDIGTTQERQNEIFNKTKAEIAAINKEHIGVHGWLTKQLNVITLAEAQAAKAKRDADAKLAVEKEITLTMQKQWEASKGAAEAGRFAGRPTTGGGGMTIEQLREIEEKRKSIAGWIMQGFKADEMTAVVLKSITRGISNVGLGVSTLIDKGVEGLKKLTEGSNKFKITMEDVGSSVSGAFTDFLLGAKSFKDSINDITKSLIRMAVQQAIMSGFTGGATAGAKGLVAMASGGVVSGPTPALIGERGPEAVIPLKRGANGELGLKSAGTNVNTTQFNLVSPDSRGIKDMLLRDPKLIKQMNESYRQGYAID